MPNTFTAEGNLGVNLNNLSTKDNNRLAKPAEGGEERVEQPFIFILEQGPKSRNTAGELDESAARADYDKCCEHINRINLKTRTGTDKQK